MRFKCPIVKIMGIVSGSGVSQAIGAYFELDSDRVIVKITNLTAVCG